MPIGFAFRFIMNISETSLHAGGMNYTSLLSRDQLTTYGKDHSHHLCDKVVQDNKSSWDSVQACLQI